MGTKIRLARGGSKKRPYYRIVAADIRAPRDGRFIEKLGTYNPLLPKTDENRVTLVKDRIEYWLGQGAKPTDRVLRFLAEAGMATRAPRNNPKKGQLGKKAQERIEAKKAKAEEVSAAEVEAATAAKAADESATEAPVESETPVEEATATEESKAEESATEESKAEEAPAEEPKAEESSEEPKEEAKADESVAEEAPKEDSEQTEEPEKKT